MSLPWHVKWNDKTVGMWNEYTTWEMDTWHWYMTCGIGTWLVVCIHDLWYVYMTCDIYTWHMTEQLYRIQDKINVNVKMTCDTTVNIGSMCCKIFYMAWLVT